MSHPTEILPTDNSFPARGPRMDAAAFDLGRRDGFSGVERCPYAPRTILSWSYWAGRVEGKADRAVLAKCIRETQDRSMIAQMLREFSASREAGDMRDGRAPPAF